MPVRLFLVPTHFANLFLFLPPLSGDAFDDDAGLHFFLKGPGLATFKAEEVSEMMLPAPKAFTRAITGSLVVSEGVADGTEAEGGPSGVSRRARRSEVEADDTDIEDGLDLESSRNVGDGFASILPGAGTFCEHENEHAQPSTCRNVLERKSTKARMVACNWRAVLQSIVLDVLCDYAFYRQSERARGRTHAPNLVRYVPVPSWQVRL